MIKRFVAVLMVGMLVGCASVNLDTLLTPFRSIVENALAACGDVPLDEVKACLKAELAASGDTEVTLNDLVEAAEAARADEATE